VSEGARLRCLWFQCPSSPLPPTRTSPLRAISPSLPSSSAARSSFGIAILLAITAVYLLLGWSSTSLAAVTSDTSLRQDLPPFSAPPCAISSNFEALNKRAVQIEELVFGQMVTSPSSSPSISFLVNSSFTPSDESDDPSDVGDASRPPPSSDSSALNAVLPTCVTWAPSRKPTRHESGRHGRSRHKRHRLFSHYCFPAYALNRGERLARSLGAAALERMAAENGFTISPSPKDGLLSCFFHSISKYLANKVVPITCSSSSIRDIAAHGVARKYDSYDNYNDDFVSFFGLSLRVRRSRQEYLDHMRLETTAAGHAEIEEIARHFDIQIRIHQAKSSRRGPLCYITVNKGGKDVVNLLYSGGNHYDLLLSNNHTTTTSTSTSTSTTTSSPSRPTKCPVPFEACASTQSSSCTPGGVRVRSINNETAFPPGVGPQTRVEHLKQILRDSTGLPVDLMRIVFDGMELAHGHSLGDYGVTDGSTLTLTLKLSGGGVTRAELKAAITNILGLASSPLVIFTHSAASLKEKVIIAGLFPPAKADENLQHQNATSREIASVLVAMGFQWSDLYPVSPTERANEFDQAAALHAMTAKTPDGKIVLTSFHKRLFGMLQDATRNGDKMPVVAWAGKTQAAALEWMGALGWVQLVDAPAAAYRSVGDVQYARMSMRSPTAGGAPVTFLGVVNVVHPSAHLMAKRRPEDVSRFRSDWDCVRAIKAAVLANNSGALPTVLDVTALVAAATAERTAAKIKAFDELDIKHKGGWVSDKLMHLRLVPWGRDGVVAAFQRVCVAMGTQDRFLRLLRSTTVHVGLGSDPEAYATTVVQMIGLVGANRAHTFLCSGVTSRLDDPDFVDRLLDLLALLQDTGKLTTIMSTDSFCARLHDDDFVDRMYQLLALLQDTGKLTTIMSSDSFCTRLHDDDFVDRMYQLLDLLQDTGKLTTIMSTNSFCARLYDDDFVDRMYQLLDLLKDTGKLTTIMSTNSFCALITKQEGLDVALTTFNLIVGDVSLSTEKDILVGAFVKLLHLSEAASRIRNLQPFLTVYAADHKRWTIDRLRVLCKSVGLDSHGLALVKEDTWERVPSEVKRKRGSRSEAGAGAKKAKH
jgi:hypothetical protein